MIDDIIAYEKQARQTIFRSEDKPLARLTELLVQLATQPIKSDNTDELIDLYFNSALWKSKAKNFLPDRIVACKEFCYEDAKYRFNVKGCMQIPDAETETKDLIHNSVMIHKRVTEPIKLIE